MNDNDIYKELAGEMSAQKSAQNSQNSQKTAAWPEPEPFEEIVTPEFPTEALPGAVGAFVEALSESTQTPLAMGAVLALGVMAVAAQRRYVVLVTPDWREQLSLFAMAVAAPAERKTAVFGALTGPVHEYEGIVWGCERAEIAQNRTKRKLLEKALDKAQNKGDEDGALALAAELAEFQDKHLLRLLMDDATPEKLTDMMQQQGGCIGVASAEGGLIGTMQGRYDKGASIDVYLKGHGGDLLMVDRMGRESNMITKPRLSMALAVQPEVLKGLMLNDVFRGRGLCGRFLYAICQSRVGGRKVKTEPIPEDVRLDYQGVIARMLSQESTGLLRLSERAEALMYEYMGDIEKRLGDAWAHMTDWGGKLVGAMIRIAGIMHVAGIEGEASETPIHEETIAAAILIAEFFGAHAEAAYQAAGIGEDYEDARYLLRRLVNSGRDEISKRDLHQRCKGKFKVVEVMEPALNRLVSMGHVRIAEVLTGGRPTTTIRLNPISKASKASKAPKE